MRRPDHRTDLALFGTIPIVGGSFLEDKTQWNAHIRADQ
jgi:hypothetical protein